MRKKSIGSSNDLAKTSRQTTAYQRGMQRDGSPHYVFLYSDDEEDDGEHENIPMETKTIDRAQPRKVEVINVHLKADDTLQALALRYRCTISELKRINKIHKENEIFALRCIKVPVQPFSIFTEEQHAEGIDSLSSEAKSLDVSSIVASVTPRGALINEIILNSVCEPLAKNLDEAKSSVAVLNAESELLLSSEEGERSSPLPTIAINTLKCSGADWGLSWIHLLTVSLLLGFAGPLIYILYIA